MSKQIVLLNAKSSFKYIVYHKKTGFENKNIKLSNSNKKNELIIRVASNFKEHGVEVFIEVKYPFGMRNKRLEIVSRNQKIIKIYKISKTNFFDKDALEIDQVLTEIKNEFNDSGKEFIGVLLFEQLPQNKVIEYVKKILSNKVDFMQNI